MTASLLSNPDQIGDGSSWIYDPRSWNTFTAGGLDWVGKFHIRNAKRKYKIDTKNAAGLEGATHTYRGYHVEHFDVTFFLWTDAQWAYWRIFSALFQYQGIKGSVFPVGVYHPSLHLVGIQSVICLSVGTVEVDENSLEASARLVLKEYIPPPLVSATQTPPTAITTSPTNTPGLTVNPAIAALQAQIAQRDATIAALGTPGGLP